MKTLFVFMKKEYLETARTGKLVILVLLFALFGVMNPAIAKLTPWMMEMFSGSLAENGLTITNVQVDALTSWMQFYKNIPIALVIFILIYHNIFIREYQTGTWILLLTKGLARYKVVLAKTVWMLILWTFGYWSCFGITYGYNQYYWDNSIADHLLMAGMCWWAFGVWTVCLVMLFSVLTGNAAATLIGTGGTVLGAWLIGFLPKIGSYMPVELTDGFSLLNGGKAGGNYGWSLTVTGCLCVLCFVISIFVISKKQIS